MTYKPLSRQALFNRAVRGLARQGWRQAREETGRCLYRAPHGRKCAIGHCIPDSRYDETMEGDPTPWNSSVIQEAARIAPVDREWASYLQGCHDGGGTLQKPAQMRRRFQAFAQTYGLTWPKDVPAPKLRVSR